MFRLGLFWLHAVHVAAELTFFLEETPLLADFEQAKNCFLDLSGPADALDEAVSPSIAEHLSAYWLTKRLEDHEKRTLIEEHADVHVLTTPFFMSFLAARRGCGTLDDHWDRMQRLSVVLKALPAFQQRKQFLVVHTSWEYTNVWGRQFMNVIDTSHVVLATADTFFCTKLYWPRRVIVPYVAHKHVADEAWASTALTAPARTTRFMFHGSFERKRDGDKRAGLVEGLSFRLPATDFHGFNFKVNTPAAVAAAVRETSMAYGNSQYCLVLPGDSATSRRLYDALAAGCVPVVFDIAANLAIHANQSEWYDGPNGPEDMYQSWTSDKVWANFPFKHTLDWTQLVVFMGPVTAAVADLDKTAATLQKLTEEDRQRLSAAGQAAVRDALSYRRGSGLVNALLLELADLSTSRYALAAHEEAAETSGTRRLRLRRERGLSLKRARRWKD